MAFKYTCTHCRQPFNTVPYVARPAFQGGELFCVRTCFENWRDDNAKQSHAHLPQHHRGNRIKK